MDRGSGTPRFIPRAGDLDAGVCQVFCGALRIDERDDANAPSPFAKGSRQGHDLHVGAIVTEGGDHERHALWCTMPAGRASGQVAGSAARLSTGGYG